MDNLRKKASEILIQKPIDDSELTQLEMKKLIEELQVHQIELELQNRELVEKRIEIEKSNSNYFSLFNLAPVGYLVLDQKAIIQQINLKATDIFQRRRDHLLRHPFVTMLERSSMSEFYDHFELAKKGYLKNSFELSLVRNDIQIWLEVTINKCIDNNYLVILIDNTERKALEIKQAKYREKLTELNATKDKFFSIIAHDLRSPFTAILGLLGVLINDPKSYDDKEREEIIETVYESANNVFKLLENLLTWATSQTGLMKYSPEKLDLKTLLFEIAINFKGQADKKDIKIVNDISENEVIYADSNMVSTVFRNLISNAIKFTAKNGLVIITSKKQTNSSFVEISIKDTGIGIPKDRFGDLFRLDKNITTVGTENENGTGLGLMLCKEFVEKHGGKIWVESEQNIGSTFSFSIPEIKD
ncbi:PAS domain-containing sensor histidine kinase [Cyclobacterium qasimii]|uniref:histidine kinase n=2 Tax=Cyclobacterium qasimii TaxID=1350429 RepID=S7VDZ8_9BACT|nr:ATP-binding protein [Cyclobacterium qasimii]EPR68470.1 Sensor protein [Cyclobacterium qasimii M12-11B]GEO23791.1 hypothetical protein CQA01_43250 [Cyclobacterium qasimii]